MATPWKHPNGTFYLRERVPRDLVAHARGREVTLSLEGGLRTVKLGEFVKMSLETKEPALAKVRYRAASAEVQEMWRRLRQEQEDGPIQLTAKQIMALAGEYYAQLCNEFEDDPGDPRGWEEGADVIVRECCPDLDDDPPSPRRIREAKEALEVRFGKAADAIRWIPWICAFTGARVGEVAQLRKEDFHEDSGISYLRITPEAGAVKGRRYRDIPLHPQLVDEGLLAFARSRGPGYLFFSAKTPDEAVKKASSVSGKLSQWVRNDVKVTDDRISPNHAWRHRFKTMCRASDIPPDYAEVLMGHEDGRAARGYGEYPITALYREIVKLQAVSV